MLLINKDPVKSIKSPPSLVSQRICYFYRYCGFHSEVVLPPISLWHFATELFTLHLGLCLIDT